MFGTSYAGTTYGAPLGVATGNSYYTGISYAGSSYGSPVSSPEKANTKASEAKPSTLAPVPEAVKKPCSSSRENIKFELVEASMPAGSDGPLYHIKLNICGRSYVAARQHKNLKTLVEQLRGRGYRIMNPFPEVDDVGVPVSMSKGMENFDMFPFYETFGYSIKSLATTIVKRSEGICNRMQPRLELVSQRIEAYLKNLFLENDGLQYEQDVYKFFWEPLGDKLSTVPEEEQEEEEECSR